MANELRMTGFDELKKEFDAFPQATKDATAPILAAWAERAKQALIDAYPAITGALRDGVELIPRVRDAVTTAITLRSGSDHAHFYEFGTIHARPHPTFLPISGDNRTAATNQIADYVEAQGVDVSGRYADD